MVGCLGVPWNFALFGRVSRFVRRLALLLLFAPTAGADSPPTLRSAPFVLSGDDRQYWAFQPVTSPSVPSAADAPTPIDAFIAVRLKQQGIEPNARATPRTLVRRLASDVLGLPPDPEEVAAFERDPSDAAWARLVDRYLASPRYGERWGRHWLDLVRYAESNGYERDGPKPNAWRYRDYVIRSFNQDKPYDRFIREQIAGDELAGELSADGADQAAWRDAIVATGFYRLHVWDDEPDSTVVAEFDDLDDIMVTTGTAFLGLTLGCVRCHDHKFDPLSQVDYYSLLSFFRGLDPYGQHKTGGGGRGTGRIERPLALPSELARWEAEKEARVEAARQRLSGVVDPEMKKQREAELERARAERAPFDLALAAVEIGPDPKATHVLYRGDAHSPRAEVGPAFPAVLALPPPIIPPAGVGAATSGRRRVLADWMSSPSNPLTARVLVNRLWQHHFGTGLVPTPDDFGRTGLLPTHPALLDFLAADFVSGGWTLKRLHRQILMSEAYRRDSDTRNERGREVDEGNVLLWRQNLRRVEAEVIRDSMLAVSGDLNLRMGGSSVFPTLSAEVHGTQDSAGKGWSDSPADEQWRRSIYLVVKRALKIPLLECLDAANSASATGTRSVTTTAPQALMLLNDSFVQVRVDRLADRVTREAGQGTGDAVDRLFQIVLQRDPAASEGTTVARLLSDQRERAVAEGKADPDRAALLSLCRVMLNLNELIHVD